MIDVNTSLNQVAYTKWPRLLVVGKPVTREQANEIIVRTTRLYYIGTNDSEWECLVQEAFGLRPELELTHADYRDDVTHEQRLAKINVRERHVEERQVALGTLDLHYLGCGERVASCYVDGPHGWCDWDGRVGTATYNVGKWPTAEEIDSDLRALAEAFPFLRMTVQLLSERYYEDIPNNDGYGSYVHDETAPVTWTVADGEVTYVIEPLPPVVAPVEFTVDFTRWSDLHRERGTSIERLREAVAQVERDRAHLTREDEDGDE